MAFVGFVVTLLFGLWLTGASVASMVCWSGFSGKTSGWWAVPIATGLGIIYCAFKFAPFTLTLGVTS